MSSFWDKSWRYHNGRGLSVKPVSCQNRQPPLIRRNKVFNKIKNVTTCLAFVGVIGIVGFSGNVFSAPDTVKFSGTINPYIEIDAPADVSLTNGGSGFTQTLSGNISWTVGSNDRFTIQSVDGYGASSSLTGASTLPQLERQETNVAGTAIFSGTGGTDTLATDFDVLNTVWGVNVTSDEVSGTNPWAGGSTPTGTPANLESSAATAIANIKDHDGTNTVVLNVKGTAEQTDDAGVYQTNLTVTVVNN